MGKIYTLKNEKITASFDSKGGEITSVVSGGREYIWTAEPSIWGRHAPVLFPFVGQVRDGKYRYDGKEFKSGQHGFARDMEFELEELGEDSISFVLRDNDDTMEKYPFHFELYITYTLSDKGIDTKWRVVNTDSKDMYFSIGGHPGFMCPIAGEGDWGDYRILFEKEGRPLKSIVIRPITTGGNVGSSTKELSLTDGCLIPSDELFAGDALIMEDSQVDRLALIDPSGKQYVAVSFDAPLAGVWSPVGKHAPFICLEPWYGRTDSDDFTGDLTEREHGLSLVPGEAFEGGFFTEIEI